MTNTYESHSVADGVWHIADNRGGVLYLVTGTKRGLLIDTGWGTGDLPALVASLTQLPVDIVNTHGHRDHAMVECGDCHDASESEDSADVLMPDIDSCRECHGGAASEAKLESVCVDCHVFHNPAMGHLYTEDESGEYYSVNPIEELSSR